MGRQIQIRLSPAAEDVLIAYIQSKFPHCRVVDSHYPPDWDRKTMTRTAASARWLMIDARTQSILIAAASDFSESGWRVRGLAWSCIEWSRTEMSGGAGRLYVNTNADPIWLDTSAACGDAVRAMFRAAQHWVRRNGTKSGGVRFPLWTVE